MDGELGEGRAATNLTTAILGSRRGGKHRGGAPGLFRSCGSVRGLVTRRRSSGAARGIVGTAVVAATANGGGGRVRWSVRERDRGGERGRGRERGVQGVGAAPGRRREASRWPGDAGRQPGGVAPARAPACSSLPAWREEAGGWHGPAQCWAGQWAARWAASGKWPGSFLSLCFLF